MPSSILLPGEHIVDDQTPDEQLELFQGQNMARGLKLSLRSAPYGAMYGATAFPKVKIIPRSDWRPMAEEQETLKSRVSDLVTAAGLPCKLQTINYCWIFATLHGLEIKRIQQGQKMVVLSAVSCGARIKNFRDVGGYGGEAIQGLIDFGADEVKHWPENALLKKYLTEASKKRALNYRVQADGFWELLPNDFDQLISCLLQGIPVSVGYDWWGHQVLACDAVWLDGEIVIRCRNSWGAQYGSNGFFILRGNRARPNDAVCTTITTAA